MQRPVQSVKAANREAKETFEETRLLWLSAPQSQPAAGVFQENLGLKSQQSMVSGKSQTAGSAFGSLPSLLCPIPPAIPPFCGVTEAPSGLESCYQVCLRVMPGWR